MPHPTAAIIAQASTEQLKEYLIGFTEPAAILAVRELVHRGESADQIIKELELQLQPSLDYSPTPFPWYTQSLYFLVLCMVA